MARTPTDTHEWLSFEDEEEERTWVFDVTFLTSNWTCIFGNGCQGVLTGPAPELVQGCCSYGAHLVDKKDARRVEKAAATLTPEEWQNHGAKKTRHPHEQARRDRHPARRRRLHLPQQARTSRPASAAPSTSPRPGGA